MSNFARKQASRENQNSVVVKWLLEYTNTRSFVVDDAGIERSAVADFDFEHVLKKKKITFPFYELLL